MASAVELVQRRKDLDLAACDLDGAGAAGEDDFLVGLHVDFLGVHEELFAHHESGIFA